MTKSSHEAELIAASDGGSKVIWCHHFLAGQGYSMESTVIAQDNQATIARILKGRSIASCSHSQLLAASRS